MDKQLATFYSIQYTGYIRLFIDGIAKWGVLFEVWMLSEPYCLGAGKIIIISFIQNGEKS